MAWSDIDAALQMISNSVALQNIDKRGATRRFYRQVFVEEHRVPFSVAPAYMVSF
jgi:hypothetical protein